MVKDEVKKLANINGFILSENADKIINAKIRFFGEKEWQKCPCDRGNEERFCCSQLCQTDIRVNGECHCGLFKLKEGVDKPLPLKTKRIKRYERFNKKI